MSDKLAFHWSEDSTVKITATSVTGNVKLLRVPSGPFQVRILNSGTVLAFIRKGADSTTTASTSNPDLPVGPGTTEVLTINNPNNTVAYIAAITASGSADLYITTGRGI